MTTNTVNAVTRDRADPELLHEPGDMPIGAYGHLAERNGVHGFFRGEASSSTS
jgi:hypothetical protein